MKLISKSIFMLNVSMAMIVQGQVDPVKSIASNQLSATAGAQIFSANTAAIADCPDGIIGLWRLDEKSGSIFTDIYGNNAIAVVPPVPTTGIAGGAQKFDSTTIVNIPDNDAFEWTKDTSFTIEAWIKFTHDNNYSRTVVGREDTKGKTGWWLGISNLEKPTFVLMDASGDDTILVSNTAIDNGLWHQIVGVWDGSINKATLYVDGIQKRVSTKVFQDDFTRVAEAMPVSIGNYNAGTKHHFVGDIDEVAIYNRALSATEIEDFYNNGNPEGHCRSVNIAPLFTSSPITAAMTSVEYIYNIVVSDINEDVLTYTITEGPAWLSIIERNDSTILIGIPENSEIYDVTISVTDNIASAVTQSFKINVIPFNATPVITNQDSISTLANTQLTLSLANFTVIDPDSDNNDFTLTVLEGSNYTVSATKITPGADFTGYLKIGVQISDGITNSAVFNTKVKVYGNIPIISGQDVLSTEKNIPITLSLSEFTVIDPDTDPADMILIVLEGTNYSVSGTTITPITDFTGNITVGVQVSDGSDSSAIFNAVVLVKDIVSVNGWSKEDIRIYPNPANDHLIISMDKLVKQASFEIYSISGELLLKQQINNLTERIDINNLNSGTYIYRLFSDKATNVGTVNIIK